MNVVALPLAIYATSLDWVWVSPMRPVHRRGVVGLDELSSECYKEV